MEQRGAGLAAVSSLDDPVRRRLYEFVADCARPAGRDEAAAAVGIGRPLAAYHLDKLVRMGLLTASYQRPADRRGPGAGRPAKVYARSGQEFAVTVPPREYELAARLLAAAVEADQGGGSRAALADAARRFGAGLGERGRVAEESAAEESAAEESAAQESAAQDSLDGAAQETEAARAARMVQAALRGHGFEPWQQPDGTIQLRNCPFRQLAAEHTEVVCGMNLALIDGLVAGLGVSGLHPALAPEPGCCCVVIGTGTPGNQAHDSGRDFHDV